MSIKRPSLKSKLAIPVLVAVLAAGIPQPAHALDHVVDLTQIAKEVAEWAKEAIEWVRQELLMSSGNVANNVGQTAVTEAIAKGDQGVIDNAARQTNISKTHDIAMDHSMILPGTTAASGNDLCSHVIARKTFSNQMEGTRTMSHAIEDATRWTGSEGTDTNYKVHMFSLLCKLGAIDKNQHGAAANGCNYTSSYHGGALSKGAVDSSGDYKWPTNITVDNNGKLNIAQISSDDDAPFNQALAHCLLLHPTSSDRTYSDSRQGNAQDLANIFDSMVAQTASNDNAAKCIRKLAVHTKVPASAGGQLANIHAMQAINCTKMGAAAGTGRMPDGAVSDCQTNGISAAMAEHYNSCPDIAFTQKIAGSGRKVDDVSGSTVNDGTACGDHSYNDLNDN